MELLGKGMSDHNEICFSCLPIELFPEFGNSHFVNKGRASCCHRSPKVQMFTFTASTTGKRWKHVIKAGPIRTWVTKKPGLGEGG